MAETKNGHTPCQQFRKRGVLNRYYDLATSRNELGQHFCQVNRPKVVNMLNWIVQQQRLPTTPSEREVDRKEKSEASGSSLPAREEKLRIQPIANLKGEESPKVPTYGIFNILPYGMRSKATVKFSHERQNSLKSEVQRL